MGTSLEVQWVKTLHFQRGGLGFDPWSGNYHIPHATQHSQKRKKQIVTVDSNPWLQTWQLTAKPGLQVIFV